MKRLLAMLLAVLTALTALPAVFAFAGAAEESRIYLSDLAPSSVTTGYGEAHFDSNLEGETLSLNNAGQRLTYSKGICIHAESSITYDISSYDLPVFYAVIGMDDGSYGYKSYAGASFELWADGVLLEDYGTLVLTDEAREVLVRLPEGTTLLTLKNGHGNDGSTWSEHCNWCDACLMDDPDGIASVEVSLSAALLLPGQTASVSFCAYTGKNAIVDPAQTEAVYSSSDLSVVRVAEDGTLYAEAPGQALIYADVTKNGKTVRGTAPVRVVSDHDGNAFLVTSPGKKVQFLLENLEGTLFYTVYKNGEKAVEPSLIGYLTKEIDLTCGFAYETKTEPVSRNEVYENRSGSYAYGRDEHTEQSFVFSKGGYFYTVTVRAYDDGYAVRSSLSRRDGSSGTLTVTDDKTAVKLPAGSVLWGSQISRADLLKGNSYESGYPMLNIENAAGKYILKAPLARVGHNLWVLLSEADIYGDPYIGSILKGIGDNTLEWAPGPQKITEDGVTTNAMIDAMSSEELDERLAAAETVGIALDPAFTFPWRYGVTGDLSEIVESSLTDHLNPPAAGDFSWVEPGFAAWMWLSEGFAGQRNEQTIREYIDLASSFGWKYLILDEGWQPGSTVPGKAYDGYFDYFDGVLSYAEEKGVGLIAWVKLCDLDTPEKREILAEWAEMGIKGIKFDFVEAESLDRMVNVKAIYEKCAEVHLLVNEHGGNIPTGERRTYPNVINRESVKGQEYGGVWCSDTTVMPYMRSAVGPTDITPKLEATGSNSASHQLALQIVIESGMPCMASDTEVYYRSNAKYILSHLPAFYDDLHFIDGYPGQYTLLARRKGDVWYVGGITDSAKSVTFPLDFIDAETTYTALLYKDGATRANIAVERFTARKDDVIGVSMLQGGGFSLMLIPEGEFVPAESLDANRSVLTLEEGTSGRILPAAAPAGAELGDVLYYSDHPGVAKVTHTGAVIAVSQGVAHITMELPSSGCSATVEVRVYARKGFELSDDWTVVNKNISDPPAAGGDEYSVIMPVLQGDTTGVPQNLLLRRAPEGDFTLTVKVTGGFSANYDSVGLAVYGGSGNMVVLTRRYHSYLGGNVFCLSNYNGGYIEKTAADARKNDVAYLKLVKTGSIFSGYYSYDGEHYEKIPEEITADRVANAEELMIGVCGIHGNTALSNAVRAGVSDFTLQGERIPFCVPASESALEVRRGSSVQVVPKILREEDAFSDLSFFIKDGAIAEIDPSGVLTAKEAGVTVLTAFNGKTGQSERFEVRVYTIGADGYGEFVIVNPKSDKMPVNDENDPYTLRMKTLTGDINGTPQNLVLTAAPKGDFTVTVKVSGGLTQDFQSIGLVAYHESGSMVTMERRSHSYFGGNVFCASTSLNGNYTENRKSDAFPTETAWLKLEKRGNVFYGSFSADGVTYTAVSPITSETVGESAKLQVGLIARTGTPVAETDAVYGDFTLNGVKLPFVAKEELVCLIAPDDFTVSAGEGLPELPETLRGFYNSCRIAELPVIWHTEGFNAYLPGEYLLTAQNEESGLEAAVTVTVESRFEKGDVNGDLSVDVTDVSLLLDILSGRAALQGGASPDIDENGELDIADVTALLNILSGR